MRTKHIISGLIIAAIAVASCRKNETITAPPLPVAGKGGKSQLKVTAKHFEKQLDSCTVYLKYNATSAPADMKFDDTANVKNINGRFMVTFDSLKQGNYFIYCKGRDLTLARPNDSLWGAGPLVIVDTFQRTYDAYINMANEYDSNTL